MCAQRGISGDDACKQACGCLGGGQTCTDTDGGQNEGVQGICKDINGEYPDDCTQNGLLKEYYCDDNNKCAAYLRICKNKCENGACS